MGLEFYISFMVHWVNMLMAGKDAGWGTSLEQVVANCVLYIDYSTVTCTASSLAPSSSYPERSVPPSIPEPMEHPKLNAAMLFWGQELHWAKLLADLQA